MNPLALTVWNGNVAPLFDSAGTLLTLRVDNTTETVDLSNKTLLDKIGLLKSLGSPVLICGAISDFSMSLVSQHGITIIPWIRGPIDEVITAYQNGHLASMRCYFLPGCGFHSHGRRFGGGNASGCRHHSPPKGERL